MNCNVNCEIDYRGVEWEIADEEGKCISKAQSVSVDPRKTVHKGWTSVKVAARGGWLYRSSV